MVSQSHVKFSTAPMSAIQQIIMQANASAMEGAEMADSLGKRQLRPEVVNIATPVKSFESPLLPEADVLSFLKMKLDAIPKFEHGRLDAVTTVADEQAAQQAADMMKRQLKIEEGQLLEASEGYQETFNSLAKMGRGTTLKAAQKLLLQWYDPLIAALKTDLEAIGRGEFKDQSNVSVKNVF